MIYFIDFVFFSPKKNVRTVGKNLLVRLHVIVLIAFQKKLTVVLPVDVRLVNRLYFIRTFLLRNISLVRSFKR